MKQMKLWMLAVILTLCGAATTWAQNVSYIECSWDETNKQVVSTTNTLVSGTYNAVNGNESEGWPVLTTGWWVVTANSTYKTLAITGDVHLIIPDGVTLTLTGGVKLESDATTSNKLTIYGQTNNTGKLTVTNSYSNAAGIGGGDKASCGTLEIHGGTIDATGGEYGAGIGGGNNQGFYGSLTIYGGNVTAQGGDYGAGIGSGDENPSNTAGFIYIYGGTITATGGKEAAGIGGGNEGNGANLDIYGGNITATGGSLAAGIGGGEEKGAGTVSIYGGTVNATGGSSSNRNGSAGIGSGAGDSYYYIENWGTINIYGGTVTAHGKKGAGIGGGSYAYGGTINISGGDVTATAEYSPGIGDSSYANAGYSDCSATVNISGGTVRATGNNACGIGGEASAPKLVLNITGGTIIAKTDASDHRAIGGKYGIWGTNNTITLHDGATVYVGDDETNNTRKDASQRIEELYKVYAWIGDCDHSDVTYTVNGTSVTDTHTKHCNYCLTTFAAEQHTFGTGTKCTVCGTTGDTYKITVKVPADSGTDGDYTSVTYYMIPGTKFPLPAPPTSSNRYDFVGWLVGEATNNSYIAESDEELLDEGYEYTINADVTFTARYRSLDIVLADNDTDDNNTNLITNYIGETLNTFTIQGRTLYKDGSWNTLCLPFDVELESQLSGATAMALSDASFADGTLTLNFTEVAHSYINQSGMHTFLTAGTPYLVKWASGGTNITNPTFTNCYMYTYETNDVTIDGVLDFCGTYDPVTISGEDKTILYLGAGNKLYYPNDKMTIGAFRAYFKLADGLTASPNPSQGGESAVRAFVLNFGDGETASLNEELRMKNEESAAVWYDLQGRRIMKSLNGQMSKGIYINNGRKIIIK